MSLDILHLQIMKIESGRNGIGSIWFQKQTDCSGKFRLSAFMGTQPAFVFENIQNVEYVAALIQERKAAMQLA